MIGQAQIQQPQTTGAPTFGGMEDQMNVSSVIGFQHPAAPVSTSHSKAMEDLRKQVEFYFGPSNYPNDTFLQQLAATYGGSVPTVVILGFPKVREIFASAAPLPHTMNPQQAEIQLLATALETSEFVNISPDGLWILAPAPPHHHQQQIMHPHLHQQPYGMPLPQQNQAHQYQQQTNGKGNIHSPYSVMALHHNGGMMFANGTAVPYGMAPQYPPHSLQMDHPQHLLPRYHVSITGGSNHSNNNNNHSHNHNHSNHNNHNNNHHHHHHHNNNNNNNNNNSSKHHHHHHQHGENKHHHQYHHQRRYSQGSTKSDGGHNNNHGHNNNKNKTGKRNKKNTRASWTAGVASTGSGGSGGGGGSEKRTYHQQGPLERRPSSNASFDSNTSNNNTNKDNKDEANGNGNTAIATNNHNHNHHNNNNKTNNNNHNSKNKKRQSFKNKDKKKQPGAHQGGGGRPSSSSSSSSSNKSSEILSDEHFPSLPNQKGQKKSLLMSHMEKTAGLGALEDIQNSKSAQPYAQALLKSTTTAGAAASSEDSTVTTVNTINTEMEKLAMDSNEDKEDICW